MNISIGAFDPAERDLATRQPPLSAPASLRSFLRSTALTFVSSRNNNESPGKPDQKVSSSESGILEIRLCIGASLPRSKSDEERRDLRGARRRVPRARKRADLDTQIYETEGKKISSAGSEKEMRN